MKSPKYISLFSGCGGLDLGFQQAGFEGILSVDLSPDSCNTFRRNHKCSIVEGDARNIDSFTISKSNNIDVLFAGPPCQGFSLIGNRDKLDPRNQLLFTPAIWAKQYRPKVVVIENVYSASAIQGKKLWERTVRSFNDLNYHCKTFVVNAKEYGVPQNRVRSILIASRKKDVSSKIRNSGKKSITLSEVFSDTNFLNHEPIILDKFSKQGVIASHIAQGQKLCDVRLGTSSVHSWNIPRVFGKTNENDRVILESIAKLRRQNRVREHGDGDPVDTERLSSHTNFNIKLVTAILKKLSEANFIYEKTRGKWEMRRTFNGKFRRLDINRISNCVLTKFGRPTDYLHPKEERGLSVREAARIQGFPDTFAFTGPLKSQWLQVGNAVPIPLAHSIALTVRDLIE